jgi:hypothetical protein
LDEELRDRIAGERVKGRKINVNGSRLETVLEKAA